MTALQPLDLLAGFQHAFASLDPDALAALYESTALIETGGAEPIRGHAAIRAMAAAFMAERPSFSLEQSQVVLAGDLALVRSRWTITTQRPGQPPATMQVTPSLVARRQADGHWLVAIDCPKPFG